MRLLDAMEGRLTAYIGDVRAEVRTSISGVRGDLKGLATKEDVHRINERLDHHDGQLAEHDGRITDLVTTSGTAAAVGSHKRHTWGVTGAAIAVGAAVASGVGAILSAVHH